jgi:hypothetical protein
MTKKTSGRTGLLRRESDASAVGPVGSQGKVRSSLIPRMTRSGGDQDGRGAAACAAIALGAASRSLDAAADGALTAGLFVRDRGRDAARALSRGERILRKSGIVGATVSTAMWTRRNAGGIVLLGAGVLAAVLVGRRARRGR